METKTCFKCGETKPISEFYEHPSMADGHLNKCKECTKRDVADNKVENPAAILATRLRVCAKRPTERNAQKAVEAAIKAGALKNPQVCYGCGCKPPEHRIEAHHHDYTKPLDVVWLCTPCHRAMDERRRAHDESAGISVEL